jgi:hypothetical protein
VARVDVRVGPCGDDLLDGVADYDDGDLTGGFVQEAGEVVCCEKRIKGEIPGDVEGDE